MRSALIVGVTGQDGAYLAQLLLDKGYRVTGTSRDPERADTSRLQRLGIADRITLVGLLPGERVQAAALIAENDEVYALSGQSSVAASFADPAGTIDSIVPAVLDLLEGVRNAPRPVRLFHAGSGDSFGDLAAPAREDSPYRPTSPYGAAKAAAQLLVRSYRRSFGLFAANGVLFNHESPLRPDRFVTRKITAAAVRIAAGSSERLRLGRTDIARDWGWAPEYVDAMWRTLQHPEARDWVLATGETRTLADFVAAAFATQGLDWRDHVDFDPALVRATDPAWSGACPDRAAELLGWRAKTRMADVARLMCEAERG